jgi:hypothetical protein
MTTAISPPEPALGLDPTKVGDATPLRAAHTPNFPALLRQMGASSLQSSFVVPAECRGDVDATRARRDTQDP